MRAGPKTCTKMIKGHVVAGSLATGRTERGGVEARISVQSQPARGDEVKGGTASLDCLKTWLCSLPSLTWLVGALLVAAAVRLPGLGQESLWVDEGTTYIRAVLPLDVVLRNVLGVRDQVPLYYLLLRLSSPAFGTSEFGLRLPSVFFGLANIPFAYLLGRSSGRHHVGVLAAWIMALNPFHVWYSREARMYSLGLLLVSIAMWCFLLALRHGGARRWMALTVTSGVAYLTHYACLAVGLVQLSVFLLTFRRTYRAFRSWILAQAVAVAPAAGWLVLSMTFHGYSGIRGTWLPKPSLLAPAKTFWNFSLLYDGRLTLSSVLALSVFALTLWSGMWRRSESDWRLSMIVWLVLLPCLALVVSYALGSVYMDRYLSICAPAYFLLLSAGLTAFPAPNLRGVLCTFLLLAMALSTLAIPRGERMSKTEWQEAAAHVLEGAKNTDRLFVSRSGLYVTYYYVGQALPITRITAQSVAGHLDAALSQDRRVWLLYRDPAESPHRLGQTERFDPYTSAVPQIASWLENHPDQIRQEWPLKGVYLALLECGDGDGGDGHR